MTQSLCIGPLSRSAEFYSIPWILSDDKPTNSLLDVIKPSFAHAKNICCSLIVPAFKHFGGRQCPSENAAWIEDRNSLCLILREHWKVWPWESFLVCFNCLRLQWPSASWVSMCCNLQFVHLFIHRMFMDDLQWCRHCGQALVNTSLVFTLEVFTMRKVKKWGSHR